MHNVNDSHIWEAYVDRDDLVVENAAQQRLAQKLRDAGYSVPDIAAQLHVSHSSIYNWTQSTYQPPTLTPDPEPTTPLPKQTVSTQPQQDTEKDYFQIGFSRAQTDTQFRTICALYWGQGYIAHSEDSQEVSLATSDPRMLRVWAGWLLQNDYGDKIKVRISVRSNTPDGHLKQYWRTQVPSIGVQIVKGSVTRPYVKMTASRYGSVYVYLFDHDLRRMIDGGIHLISTSIK